MMMIDLHLGAYSVETRGFIVSFRNLIRNEIQALGLEDKFSASRKWRVLDRREPEELETTILYLAAPGSGFITGSAIYVDGGWTAQ